VPDECGMLAPVQCEKHPAIAGAAHGVRNRDYLILDKASVDRTERGNDHPATNSAHCSGRAIPASMTGCQI
jgi:hypothetical protein